MLRYLYREGLIDRDLSTVVELPRTYELSNLPRSISWDEVRRMLEAVDRRTATGRRDYAILLLLVTYGLRALEVAAIKLDDIDWKSYGYENERPDTPQGMMLCLVRSSVKNLKKSPVKSNSGA
jgi:integrase